MHWMSCFDKIYTRTQDRWISVISFRALFVIIVGETNQLIRRIAATKSHGS